MGLGFGLELSDEPFDPEDESDPLLLEPKPPLEEPKPPLEEPPSPPLLEPKPEPEDPIVLLPPIPLEVGPPAGVPMPASWNLLASLSNRGSDFILRIVDKLPFVVGLLFAVDEDGRFLEWNRNADDGAASASRAADTATGCGAAGKSRDSGRTIGAAECSVALGVAGAKSASRVHPARIHSTGVHATSSCRRNSCLQNRWSCSWSAS